MAETDLISRQAVIEINQSYHGQMPNEVNHRIWKEINELPSVQPERMTNRQWIDFLSAQFDISRTSAKEMLHRMMQWKKEDNFKKLFNKGQEMRQKDKRILL